MMAVLFISQLAASSTQSKLDAALGYPLAGVNIGAGLHAPPDQSATLRRVDLLKHPTLASWALPVDGVDVAKLGASDKTVVLSAVTLTADWTPTVVAGPTEVLK